MTTRSLVCVLTFVAGAVSVACAGALASPFSADVKATESAVFPSVMLRGYGRLSGESWQAAAPSGSASLLRIHCADAGAAKLVAAKYLSDIALLPHGQAMTAACRSSAVPGYAAEGQGAVAAGRVGADVSIFAAASAGDLAWTIDHTADISGAVWKAEVTVPMYLDRWDKYSFRHYYWALQLPKGESAATYDYNHEFDWAQAEDHAGILLAKAPLATDSAEGMMNVATNAWIADEARQHNLPVELHLDGGVGSEPTWFLNDFRDQQQMRMPGFTGGNHRIMTSLMCGQGVLSWNSQIGQDAYMGLFEGVVKRFKNDPNVTSYLEPHNELKHGAHDIFLEYGPVADENYRRYLKGKYATPLALASRWQMLLRSWDDVHVPEIAKFAGLRPDSIDIGKSWRVGYEDLIGKAGDPDNYDERAAVASKAAPAEWFSADFDDSSWPDVPGGGNDDQMFLTKRPAVFRCQFDVSASWFRAHKRVWVYEWDLNEATDQVVRVVLNGQEIGSSKILFVQPHWSAFEATGALRPGSNTLAIRVPQGYVAYKTYLSSVEPAQYPNLGQGLNAQWVDFTGFTQWYRADAVRQGMAMIRRNAPDPQIVLMSPTEFADGIMGDALAYGGEFHDTGAMGSFWDDYPADVSRGSDLPVSVEPGSPAVDFADWQRQWGRWQCEGVNAVDYFIHIGSILWQPEIKADYEAHRKQISLIGQSHFQKAEVAVLYSNTIAELTGYPWGASPNTGLPGGYWRWNAAGVLRGIYPYDGLTASCFERGQAQAYKVIVDSNTSIMDEKTVAEIENYVRGGGVFVTVAQTGRSTPERADAWPIARLTGYAVTHIDRLNPDGSVSEQGRLSPAPGQSVYDASWSGSPANGLHLRKAAPDAQDLLLWSDGTVAAGVRPIGKGYIVQLGAKFTGDRIFDRVEPGGNNPETLALRKLISAILEWRGIKHESARLSPENEQVWLRPRVTNNGLYDVWTLWNWSETQTQTVSVALNPGKHPAFAFDARDGSNVPVTQDAGGDRIDGIVLQPRETRVILTPRDEIALAPAAWFDLQRKWWRGTTMPERKTLPAPRQTLSLDLSEEWKVKTLDSGDDATPLLGAQVSDASWLIRPSWLWNTASLDGKKHAVLRKSFIVPAKWTNGRVGIWMTGWVYAGGGTFFDRGRVWLDGAEVKPMNGDPYIDTNIASLKAGTVHTLAVEVQGKGQLVGLGGQCWLAYEPAPGQKIDLAGAWTASNDALRYDIPATLPGKYHGQIMKRSVFIGSKLAGKKAVVTVDGDRMLIGVLINGKLVRRHHHLVGSRWSLDVTPFVQYGADNKIQLIHSMVYGGPMEGYVHEAFIGFYDKNALAQ
ncbi:MAG: hypothetical protein P4L33_08065 [Capsulimonadaceae bacterium]|nr:hypothetical protein [Capsulimonadaceae bacterium]